MRRTLLLVLAVNLVIGVGVGGAQAQPADDRFPSDDPDPRVGTPNDPRFDCAESDDEDASDACTRVFDEQYNLFGFAPDASELTALYRDAARFGQPQVSGVSADLAWKTTIGSPDVVIAVTDTGIDWSRESLRRKVFLNTAELPLPSGASVYDADGDGAVTVDDWSGDPRVTDANGNDLLDGQDLIRAFSDGIDDDANGYVDDIAGWDWLNDDNDPSDTSSASSAHKHGSGRMEEAAEETHDGRRQAGICPRCRVLPLKVWDSFVVPGDNWALATVYTADIGAHAQVVANGVLGNTRTMQLATRYAYEHDVALLHVSSDLNTASHNYPTNYRESIFVNGCVADVDAISPNEFSGEFDQLPVPADPPIGTWFRQANLTQHGAHAHVCFMGPTGSQATGQAGGAAGLIVSRGLEVADDIGGPLTAGEVKQILTLSAEDVLPENTVGTGIPDPAQVGWDEHFGYGRADLAAAVAMVAPGTIPPEALIHEPAWWHLLDPVATPEIPVTGEIAARRSSGWLYELEWAPGVEPPNDGFTVFASGEGTAAFEGELGRLPMGDIAAALPGAADGTPPADPNTYVFTVRLRVTDADGNEAEDRRAYFAFHDPDQPDGWPRFVDSGGESSQVLYDLDGDGTLEIIEADSSGRVSVVGYDAQPLTSFNGGRAWQIPPPWFHHPDAPGFRSGAVPPPTGQARTPIVGDIDGDLEPELAIASMDGRVWLLDASGAVEDGFPVSVDPSLSREEIQSGTNHVKRGFLGTPSAADLDGDGTLEIVATALDGHVYVWEHDGSVRPGFPRRLADPDEEEFNGGEAIVTPGLGDLDGDGDLEIVAMSNEVYDAAQPAPPASLEDVQAGIFGLVTNLAANAIGGTGRLYALQDDGSFVDGWPVAMNGLLPDILPLVGPAHAVALVDVDGDGDDEVVGSLTSGEVNVFDGDGSVLATLPSTASVGANTDPTKIVNLFEYAVVGNLDGQGGPDVAKAGLSLNGVLNLLATGQNLPFNHVIQAWDAANATPVAGFPVAHDDYLLLSTPIVADLDESGTGEVLASSGLYLLHAYGQLGQEAAGFPKLHGGWTVGIPSVGDVDGDGDIELVVGTREGWRHLWDLDTTATAGALGEWWTEGHDEWHTLRYGTDTRPPSRVTDLAVGDRDAGASLTFTAPGDDWQLGAATSYEVRVSSLPVAPDGWGAVPVAATFEASVVAGTSETLTMDVPADAVSLALIAVDDAGNRSQPAVAALEPAAPPPPPLPATGGGVAVAALLLAAAGTRLRQRSPGDA